MSALLRLLWDICWLKHGPQDLPYSPALTRGLVLLTAGIDLLFVQLTRSDEHAFAQLALSLLMLLMLPWLLLELRGLRARYPQTLTALAGTGVLFTLFFLPLAMLTADLPLPTPDTPPTRAQLTLGWLTLLLVGWKLVINAHIWRHAMSLPFAAGLLLALSLFLLEIGLVRGLLGATD